MHRATLLLLPLLGGLAACERSPAPARTGLDSASAVVAGSPLRVVATIGDSGSTIEGLAAHDGVLYTADWKDGTVYRVHPASGAAAVARLPVKAGGWILGLATDAAGNLYAAAPDEGVVWRIEAGRLGAADFDVARDVRTFATGAQGANGIAVAPDGHLWISGGDQNVVYHVPPEGGAAQVFARGYATISTDTTIPVRGYVTNGLGIDAAGHLYTANTGTGEITRLEVLPGYRVGAITSVVRDARLVGADGIVAEGDTLYVTANYSNAIARIDPSGGVTMLAEDATGATLRFPAEIKKVGGTLYVANLNFPVGRNAGQPVKGATVAALALQ